MASKSLKRNERDWAGQLISWLKAAIEKKQTIFQDATNDTSVKMKSGKTKFPDILLFTDKTSGIIFNGWELKFPDTPVDDAEMLDNALEKAKSKKVKSRIIRYLERDPSCYMGHKHKKIHNQFSCKNKRVS